MCKKKELSLFLLLKELVLLLALYLCNHLTQSAESNIMGIWKVSKLSLNYNLYTGVVNPSFATPQQNESGDLANV